LEPCSRCRKLLKASGVLEFKFANAYVGDRSIIDD
jgi:hypothetical protein